MLNFKKILPGFLFKKQNSTPLTIKVMDFNLVATKPNLLKKLRSLTIRPESGLNHELNHLLRSAQNRTVRSKIVVAVLEKNIVGWGLLSREDSSFCFSNTWNGFSSNDGVLFELYVDPHHRRKGVGTEIIKTARKHSGPLKLCIAPWDDSSRAFYNTFKKYKTKEL